LLFSELFDRQTQTLRPEAVSPEGVSRLRRRALTLAIINLLILPFTVVYMSVAFALTNADEWLGSKKSAATSVAAAGGNAAVGGTHSRAHTQAHAAAKAQERARRADAHRRRNRKQQQQQWDEDTGGYQVEAQSQSLSTLRRRGGRNTALTSHGSATATTAVDEDRPRKGVPQTLTAVDSAAADAKAAAAAVVVPASGARTWTLHARWLLCDINELPHVAHRRLEVRFLFVRSFVCLRVALFCFVVLSQ
jgi:hypothetical protein